MGRGLLCRCPNCGRGPLFAGFLTQAPTCTTCNEQLGAYNAGLLTSLLVGLLVVFGFAIVFMAVELAGGASPGTYMMLLVPVAIAVPILALRPVKGALVGMLWSLGASDQLDR
jgi:uncharacterized protein (DUF983 family)